MKKYHIAIVGATGAVGAELLARAGAAKFSGGEPAPDRIGPIRRKIDSVSRRIDRGRRTHRTLVRQDRHRIFQRRAAKSRAKFVPTARDAGAIVIDNSPAFRMDADVPLVIPEINGDDVKNHHGIIANPNCTTAVALMAIYPLHRAFGVRRVFAASYQAVSGSGRARDRGIEKAGRSGRARSTIASRRFIRIRSRSTFCRTSIRFSKAVTPKKK